MTISHGLHEHFEGLVPRRAAWLCSKGDKLLLLAGWYGVRQSADRLGCSLVSVHKSCGMQEIRQSCQDCCDTLCEAGPACSVSLRGVSAPSCYSATAGRAQTLWHAGFKHDMHLTAQCDMPACAAALAERQG